MANNNPYMLGGFQGGFMQGLEAVYRQREFERQSRLDEYRIKEAELGLKTGEANLERERVGLERDKVKAKQEDEQLEYNKGLRPMQERAMRNQSALAVEQAASMRETRRKTKLDTDQRQEAANAAKAQVHLEQVFKLGPRVAENISNPEYLRSGEAFDAFVNGGMVMDGATVENLKSDAAFFLMSNFGAEIRQGIGDPVDAKTAEKIGAPKGSIITDKKIVDFHIEGDNVVIELDVITKNDKSPEPWTYKAPITEDRSSKGTDQIMKFPISRLKEIAAAGGSFAQAVRLRQEQNPNQDPKITAKELSDGIQASLAAMASRLKPHERLKIKGNELIDITTGQAIPLKKNLSPDAASKIIRDVYNSAVREVGEENVNMDQVLARSEIMKSAAEGENAGPKKGDIEDGYEFQGGDPKDPANWKQVSTGGMSG